jgi:hypothetical protein
MTGLPNALEAARRIASGNLTSEALRACLDRIGEREPQVQAWQHLDMRCCPEDGLVPGSVWLRSPEGDPHRSQGHH